MNIARRLVSKKKKRYQEGGFDLGKCDYIITLTIQ